jgi:aspartokinase/homoserine dehydrogenase 1
VACIVKEVLENGSSEIIPNLAIVVSAMGGKPKTTDLLLNAVTAAASRQHDEVEAILHFILEKHCTCIEQLFNDEGEEQTALKDIIKKDLDDIRDILKTVSLMKWQATRISELVSGYGEIWSTQILNKLLQKRSNESEAFVFLDARRVITIDEEAVHNGAVCWDICKTNLEQVYEEEQASSPDMTLHFVITGYVACNTHGVATTLQRDGSDYSAAIMGKLLNAKNITIWTDVDGVLSADPRRVPSAHVLPEVSYNEAMELAYFGAKVIHPKTMQPAISAIPQIPIFIRNTFNSAGRGSRIYTSSTTHTDRDKCVCGFSSIEDMALINVEGSGLIGVPGVAKRMFGTLENLGVNVVLISQASSEHSITFATVEAQVQIAKMAIEEEFRRELKANLISNVDVKAPCAIIAAVGDGMSSTAGVSGRFFTALGNAKINVLAISQGCSERNISAVVWTRESTRALRAVHAAFRLSHTIVRIGIIGMKDLGESLVKLLESQRTKLRDTFEVDLQVCVVASDGNSSDLVCLKDDHLGRSDSITVSAYTNAIEHDGSDTVATVVPGGLETFQKKLVSEEYAYHVVFDCTAEASVGKWHAEWLQSGVHVITANSFGLAGPKVQREAIAAAERANGKLSASYLREVTVGGALPIIRKLRNLLQTGDKIRRIDGILSTSLSFIMFRISPPPGMAECSKFDEISSKGAFSDDMNMSPSGGACLFSEAMKEAIARGLMEEEPGKDLNNEYTARCVMILANELGLDYFTAEEISEASDKLVESCDLEGIDFNNMSADDDRVKKVDRMIQERVMAAESKGCVLRHIGSVDVNSQCVEIRLVEVPNNHAFATTPPSCECFRFFTHRYLGYPLIIQVCCHYLF